MIIRSFVGKPIDARAYLVAGESSPEAIVIDAPGGIADQVVEEARKRELRIVALVCTHGHFDHVLDLAELKKTTGAPVLVHVADAAMLESPTTGPFLLPFEIPPCVPDRLLTEGEEVQAGSLRFVVLHTPGHTPGSICLHEESQGVVFTGDTLFAGGFGRTDLPGGDVEALAASLGRLTSLPAATRAYPGHGPRTTIGAEGWLSGIGT